MTTADTAQTTPALTPQSKNLATLSHLSAFAIFVGVPPVVGPLVMWLVKKDDPFVGDQAREALNFNISFLIYAIAAAISLILIVGVIALPAVLIAWFVLVIVAAVRAANGETYRYPFTMRFVS
jgi:uncharacterized Tic20 family protein